MRVSKVSVVISGHMTPLIMYARNKKEVSRIVERCVTPGVGVAVTEYDVPDDTPILFYYVTELPTFPDPCPN